MDTNHLEMDSIPTPDPTEMGFDAVPASLDFDDEDEVQAEPEEEAPRRAKKTKSKNKKSAKSAPKTAEEIAATWQNWATKNGDLATNPYRLSSTFEVGEAMKHPTFGKGFVSEVTSPKKIDVIFEVGMKKLVHNLQN